MRGVFVFFYSLLPTFYLLILGTVSARCSSSNLSDGERSESACFASRICSSECAKEAMPISGLRSEPFDKGFE